jgi:hypothetical protein
MAGSLTSNVGAGTTNSGWRGAFSAKDFEALKLARNNTLKALVFSQL